jgi:hypothetical protein
MNIDLTLHFSACEKPVDIPSVDHRYELPCISSVLHANDSPIAGPVYYSALVVAEALGSSNIAQVLDLDANGGSDYTPGYAIYENGQPVRVALTNFISDPSGNSDYTAKISIGGTVPAQVQVK